LYVDFRDLNRASLKDHYPLPSMEQILQVVAGSERFSLLDGFSSYNQVLVKEEDQFETAFTTKWGTMAYRRMPFGLSNASSTFQRAMDMAFKGLMYKLVLVYLDDITVFSKNASEHLSHLRLVFERCREFGISLNPKKCIFVVHEGKLLGHIVSKEGVTIDKERIHAILQLPLPSHKKGLQCFIGRINFLRRFIPDIANLLKPLTSMLKKNITFSWTSEARHSFQSIKEALVAVPTLINPDFSKDFILYAYGVLDTISAILVQQQSESFKQPIAFFSQGLEEYEQKYSFIEKHFLVVVKSLKKFRHLVSNNKIHLMVAHPSVKEFLLSRDVNEKRAGWITKVMQYDVEIKITKLVRGRVLSEQLVTSSKDEVEEEEEVLLIIEEEHQDGTTTVGTSWVNDMIQFLQTGRCPTGLDKAKRRYFRLQSIPYVLIEGILFRKDFNGVLLRCIDTDQTDRVLHEFYDGTTGGHFAPRTTAWKVMRAGYY